MVLIKIRSGKGIKGAEDEGRKFSNTFSKKMITEGPRETWAF